jgi:hypothetical protein
VVEAIHDVINTTQLLMPLPPPPIPHPNPFQFITIAVQLSAIMLQVKSFQRQSFTEKFMLQLGIMSCTVPLDASFIVPSPQQVGGLGVMGAGLFVNTNSTVLHEQALGTCL